MYRSDSSSSGTHDGQRKFGFRERDQPGPGPYDDMIRPRDGSTILFFTAADVFAMSKGNITTQSKLSRVLIDGGSTGNMIPRGVVP